MTVEIVHPTGVVAGTVTDVIPKEDAATPGRGLVEINHPGGACWVGVTPDIRAGDVVRITNQVTGDGDPRSRGDVLHQRQRGLGEHARPRPGPGAGAGRQRQAGGRRPLLADVPDAARRLARDALAAGTHTITLTVLGKKSPLNPGRMHTGAKCAQVDVEMATLIR